jgi:site-specific recombinase XerD
MPLLLAWAGWMRGAGMSERTITERLRVVEQFAQSIDANPAVSRWQDVAGWLGSNPEWSAGTRHNYFRVLRAWFRWLVEMDERVDDPMVKLKAPKSPKYEARPVASKALDALLGKANRRRTRAMVILAAYQGLRVHEIARMRGDMIDGEWLRVRGKGNTDRMLPLDALVAVEALHFPTEGLWFPSYTDPNQPISRQSVSAAIGSVMKRAGVKGSAHQLRHWYGTEMLAGGANLRVVQENMRHASIGSTAIYTKVADADRRAAIDSLPRPEQPPAA